MPPKVHILATCRNPELFRATTLVFDTLRVGFPTAEIIIHDNNLYCTDREALIAVVEKKVGKCYWPSIKKTIHHQWIEQLLATEKEPFIILDTDIVFWKNCEGFDYMNAPLSGRRIPMFKDPFTKCRTHDRLHGSFLYFNPARIKEETDKFLAEFPKTPFNPLANLIHPQVIPQGRYVMPDFFDTCALLYNAIGGLPFSENQLNCYDHMNCGTISDIVAPHLDDIRMREAHFAVFENMNLLRGIWRQQDDWYRKHAV